nr:MAG TPA: hypothetical protein [Caudoviricetes sp.]
MICVTTYKNRLTHDRSRKGQKATYKPYTNRKEG